MNNDTNNPLKDDTECKCKTQLKNVDDKITAIEARFGKLNTQLTMQFKRIADTFKRLATLGQDKNTEDIYK